MIRSSVLVAAGSAFIFFASGAYSHEAARSPNNMVHVGQRSEAAFVSALQQSGSSITSAVKNKQSTATYKRVDAIMKHLRHIHAYFENVAVSPNGKSLAWVIETKRGEALKVAKPDGSDARTITVNKHPKYCSYIDLAWAPNSRSLAFLANCNQGKQAPQRDVFIVNTLTKTTKRLTHLRGYVHDLAWVPNGKSLSFLYVHGDLHAIDAESATKPKVGVIGQTGVEHQVVATVSAGGGKAASLTPRKLFVYEYSWSPDSHKLAYVAAPPPGRDNWWVADLYTQTAHGSSPHNIVDTAKIKGSLYELQLAHPVWSPDSSTIAFIGGLMSDQGVIGGDIYTVSADGGFPTNITPGIKTTPSWMTFTGRHSILASSFAGGSTQLSSFVLHGKEPASQHKLLTLHADISDRSAISAVSLAKNGCIAFIQDSFEKPPEVYTGKFNVDSNGQMVGVARAPHAITHANIGIKPVWGKSKSVTWKSDGYNVQGWLLFPAHYNSHKAYPMIVYVHGGPVFATRPRWPRAGWGAAPLSAMGYFVLMPNPRGSYGQGEKFTQAIRKNMGYGDLRDILRGVDAVEAKYPIDKQRLGITGWSYGGFMSMFAPTQTNRFKAAVVGAGVSDWKSYYGENSIDQWMLPFFGASVYVDPKVYAKSSAINFIKHNKTPSLILVGQLDGEAPAPQSFEFWRALKAYGVPTKLVVYPGEGHGFHKQKDQVDLLKRAMNWFGTYLGEGTNSE